MITELNDRSRDIFRRIVEAYVETGDPVGSRTLSRQPNLALSPATIRNVMADLEDLGLLFAPHTSAGRLPTQAGLRLYVDGLMEVGNLDPDARTQLTEQFAGMSNSVEGVLEQATSALSGLSNCASMVVAPKAESPLKHIEFVALNPGRALAVMVAENGIVENRLLETPPDLPPSALVQASNYLSQRLVGRTIAEAYDEIMTELDSQRAQLDQLTARMVENGLAVWSGEEGNNTGSLIVKGQSNLLGDMGVVQDLEKIRSLFSTLETKEQMLRVLSLADRAEGVQIFIGAENNLFDLAGCSMVVRTYQNSERTIVGAIGVIGPSRMNYARIIPMVDYTAELVSRQIG